MNHTTFFSMIRPMFPGGLKPVQVQVINAILLRSRDLSDQHLAYILATAYGEAKLTPVRENMNYSAAGSRKTWRTRPEAVQFAGKPQALANSVYGGRLGNKVGTNDGWFYRGGGVDQLTGRDNYRRMGIENSPEAILQPEVAALSIVNGMVTGRYTGKKLTDYGVGSDFSAARARAIVNADVGLNGARYAAHYKTFLAALQTAGRGTEPEVRPDAPVMPMGQQPAKPLTGWAALFSAIAAMFRGK